MKPDSEPGMVVGKLFSVLELQGFKCILLMKDTFFLLIDSLQKLFQTAHVITSYSIHYTKLYDLRTEMLQPQQKLNAADDDHDNDDLAVKSIHVQG